VSEVDVLQWLTIAWVVMLAMMKPAGERFVGMDPHALMEHHKAFIVKVSREKGLAVDELKAHDAYMADWLIGRRVMRLDNLGRRVVLTDHGWKLLKTLSEARS
jgi:hypothetical protein